VTLTASPESGQSFLGWSGGGCSGTAPTCIVTISADTTVGASFTSIQPPAPGAPKVSAASVSGLTSGRRKLAFAINAGENAPAIQTVVIAPPSGVSFSKKAKDLKQDITVYGPDGKRLRSTAKVGAGRLTITLKTPARALEVTITGAELALSRSFVSKLKRRTLKSFAVLVTALDAGGTPTVLRLAFKLR
jgi:hypothetical protein